MVKMSAVNLRHAAVLLLLRADELFTAPSDWADCGSDQAGRSTMLLHPPRLYFSILLISLRLSATRIQPNSRRMRDSFRAELSVSVDIDQDGSLSSTGCVCEDVHAGGGGGRDGFAYFTLAE